MQEELLLEDLVTAATSILQAKLTIGILCIWVCIMRRLLLLQTKLAIGICIMRRSLWLFPAHWHDLQSYYLYSCLHHLEARWASCFVLLDGNHQLWFRRPSARKKKVGDSKEEGEKKPPTSWIVSSIMTCMWGRRERAHLGAHCLITSRVFDIEAPLGP